MAPHAKLPKKLCHNSDRDETLPAFRLAEAEANLREALTWAGTVLRFTPSLRVIARKKGSTDFALLADLRIEAGIRRILSKGSTVPVVSEESDAGVDVRYLPAFWSVDPIDGTVNYARSLPECGVSIALVVRGQALLAGVTFPFLGEVYFAAAGCGAFLNGRRIRIAPTSRLFDAVVAFGDLDVHRRRGHGFCGGIGLMRRFALNALRLRTWGSTAMQLTRLASGRIDVSVTLNNIHWDVQAAGLIAREAGAVLYTRDGSSHDLTSAETFASSARLRPAVCRLLHGR